MSNHPSNQENPVFSLSINENLLIFVLALVQFTHIIDFMIIMPLGNQFMETFDISPQQFSWIVSSYAGAAFISGLISALFIDRFDRKDALLILYIGFTIGTFACSFASNYLFFLIARAFTGFFGGIIAALILSIVADVIPFERRASAMGIVMTAFSVASIAGVPLGLFLAAEFGWRIPFLSLGGLAAITCLLIYFFIPQINFHLQSSKKKTAFFQSYINIFQDLNQIKALSFTFILMLGHFTIIPFIAPYMQSNIGFSDYEITYIYMLGGIFSVICLPLFGRLADRFGSIKIFTVSSCFAIFSIYAITNLDTHSILLALTVTSSFFIVASGRSVPATTLVTSVVKAENRGSFMTIRSSLNELGLAISSAIAGAIIVEDSSGELIQYNYVGYITIVMSIIAIFLARQLKIVDKN